MNIGKGRGLFGGLKLSEVRYDRNPALEKHIWTIIDHCDGDGSKRNSISESMSHVAKEGYDPNELWDHPLLNQKIKIREENQAYTKYHAGIITRALHDVDYDRLSTSDQSIVMESVTAICDKNGYPKELLGLEGHFNRGFKVITFVRAILSFVFEYTIETNDTASKMMMELKERMRELDGLYEYLYKDNKWIVQVDQIDKAMRKEGVEFDVPDRGFKIATDNLRLLFLRGSLLADISLGIYRVVETISIVGPRGGERVVKNIQDLSYNYLSTKSHKSRRTRSGQEHMFKGVGVDDIQILDRGTSFEIDSRDTKMQRLKPGFAKFEEELFQGYDFNFYTIETFVVESLDDFNNIMAALDKINMEMNDLEYVINVCKIQLELNSLTLTKTLERLVSHLTYMAEQYKEHLLKLGETS